MTTADRPAPLQLCPARRHPAARMYVHPRTGRNHYCRDCRQERRDEVSGRSSRIEAPPTERVRRPLAPARLRYLRALAACAGCGAVREDWPDAKTTATTRIRHRKGCSVDRNKETQP